MDKDEYKIEYQEKFYDPNFSNVINLLNIFYQKTLGIGDDGLRRPFGFYVKDHTENLVGGLVGLSELRWMYLDSLYIVEQHRSQGIAASLLKKADELAVSRNCCGIKLETYDELVGFFEKFGYVKYYTEKRLEGTINIHYLKKEI